MSARERRTLGDGLEEDKLNKYGPWKRRGDNLILATIEGKSVPGKKSWKDIRSWRNRMKNAIRLVVKRNAHSRLQG